MGDTTPPENVDPRISSLEKWQGIVDYRLDDGDKRFSALEKQMVAYGVKQGELELHVLNGNRDTAELKQSWQTWMQEEKERRKEEAEQRRLITTNRPKWWQVVVGIAAVGVSAGSLTVAILVLGRG